MERLALVFSDGQGLWEAGIALIIEQLEDVILVLVHLELLVYFADDAVSSLHIFTYIHLAEGALSYFVGYLKLVQ